MSSNPNLTEQNEKRDALKVRPAPSDWKKWIGVVPFFLFTFLFILLPSISLFVGSFQDTQGNFTLKNFIDLSDPNIVSAYWVSIRISAATAVGGGILGFFLAYAVTVGGLPRWVRNLLTTFSGVASNFAGVPLAFAFIATLGRTGMITVILKTVFGVDLYNQGFSLYSFLGLTLTYIFFPERKIWSLSLKRKQMAVFPL